MYHSKWSCVRIIEIQDMRALLGCFHLMNPIIEDFKYTVTQLACMVGISWSTYSMEWKQNARLLFIHSTAAGLVRFSPVLTNHTFFLYVISTVKSSSWIWLKVRWISPHTTPSSHYFRLLFEHPILDGLLHVFHSFWLIMHDGFGFDWLNSVLIPLVVDVEKWQIFAHWSLAF